MKRSFLLTCLGVILTTLSARAQVPALPKDSALWVYGLNLGVYPITYLVIKFRGDTILNGMEYTKVYYAINDTNYLGENDKLNCFVRCAGKKAWVRYPYDYMHDTSDVLIYNFELNLYDTLYLPVFRRHHQPPDEYYCRDSNRFVVTSISWSTNNIYFPGDTLVGYNLTPLNTNWCSTTSTYYTTQFYGLDDYLFYNESDLCYGCGDPYPDSVDISQLNCFRYKGIWANGLSYCLMHTGISSTGMDNGVELSPNPCTGVLNIGFNENIYSRLSIRNVYGSILLQQFLQPGITEQKLELNTLPEGIYFLILESEGGKRIVKKFVML